MRRDISMMVALARQAADPAFGYHLLLLRDAGYLDRDNQITEAGKAFIAGVDAAGKDKPLSVEGLAGMLNYAAKCGISIELAKAPTLGDQDPETGAFIR